jgi:hypothetical protein
VQTRSGGRRIPEPPPQRDERLLVGEPPVTSLTPERVGEIRQQMIDGGLDPATDPMVAVGADEPSPTP